MKPNTPVRSRQIAASALTLALGLLVPVTAQAQTTLIADGFADGARTNGADANDAAWLSTSSAGVAVIDDVGFVTGKALDLATGGGVLHTTFSSTTLNVGDTLALSFSYRLGADIASFGNSLRVGLMNSGGTHPTGDNSSGTLNDDVGYMIWANSGSNGANTTIRRDANSENPAGTNSQFFNSSFATQLDASGAGVDVGTTLRSASFIITRDSETSVSITANIGGGSFVAADLSPVTFTFDYLGFRFANNTTPVTSLILGDVNLTYTAVPEPSAFATLAGFGALAFAARRRRRSAE